jgi:SAM-dependent methyltransferase
MNHKEFAETSRENQSLYDKKTIRDFMTNGNYKKYFVGRILDYGCGAQPYKDLFNQVNYFGYDPFFPEDREKRYFSYPFIADPNRKFDTIIANQVFECVDNPVDTMRFLGSMLNPGGCIVVTYNTAWFEWARPGILGDYWRFSRLGMEKMMTDIGLVVLLSEERWSIDFQNVKDPNTNLCLGYATIARKTG